MVEFFTAHHPDMRDDSQLYFFLNRGIVLGSVLANSLFREVDKHPVGSLLFVERVDELVIITRGRESLFREWEEKNGGFRRYSSQRGDWDKNDVRKFNLLEQARRLNFFLIIEEGNLKIYPPRHLCV